MQKSISEAVQHHTRDLLLQASSEDVLGNGGWWASFAVFTDDHEKALVYWMPTLFRLFATEHEAQEAARGAGLRFIENLDEQQLGATQLDNT